MHISPALADFICLFLIFLASRFEPRWSNDSLREI
jgi:hypothetical protein